MGIFSSPPRDPTRGPKDAKAKEWLRGGVDALHGKRPKPGTDYPEAYVNAYAEVEEQIRLARALGKTHADIRLRIPDDLITDAKPGT